VKTSDVQGRCTTIPRQKLAVHSTRLVECAKWRTTVRLSLYHTASVLIVHQDASLVRTCRMRQRFTWSVWGVWTCTLTGSQGTHPRDTPKQIILYQSCSSDRPQVPVLLFKLEVFVRTGLHRQAIGVWNNSKAETKRLFGSHNIPPKS